MFWAEGESGVWDAAQFCWPSPVPGTLCFSGPHRGVFCCGHRGTCALAEAQWGASSLCLCVLHVQFPWPRMTSSLLCLETLTSPSRSHTRAPSLVLGMNSYYLTEFPCDQWHTVLLASLGLSLPFGHPSPAKLTLPSPLNACTHTHTRTHTCFWLSSKILSKFLGKTKLCFWLEFLFEHFSEGLVYTLTCVLLKFPF